MRDSKDLELKAAFRECPSSLEVFKITSLGAHNAMAPELKYHQKYWSKIIVNRILELLYASTITFSTEQESLRSHISMSASSAKLTSFLSPSHELLASPDSVSNIWIALREKKHVNIISNKNSFKKNCNMFRSCLYFVKLSNYYLGIILVRIQSEYGEIQTRITLNLDTFHPVYESKHTNHISPNYVFSAFF